jgi:hypothetical protein
MFILSVTFPPKAGAEHGETTVSDPLPSREKLFTAAYWAFRSYDGWMHPEVANKKAEQVMRQGLGEEVVEADTGLRFRIDNAGQEPEEGEA